MPRDTRQQNKNTSFFDFYPPPHQKYDMTHYGDTIFKQSIILEM